MFGVILQILQLAVVAWLPGAARLSLLSPVRHDLGAVPAAQVCALSFALGCSMGSRQNCAS